MYLVKLKFYEKQFFFGNFKFSKKYFFKKIKLFQTSSSHHHTKTLLIQRALFDKTSSVRRSLLQFITISVDQEELRQSCHATSAPQGAHVVHNVVDGREIWIFRIFLFWNCCKVLLKCSNYFQVILDLDLDLGLGLGLGLIGGLGLFQFLEAKSLKKFKFPASITSTDDFVLTSAKLAILETTIGNYNEKSLDLITPNTVLTWIRAEIAHRTASSGLQWAEAFGRHNSGTYNNEWVVVDYKQFHRGKEVQPETGIIHVVEQMP